MDLSPRENAVLASAFHGTSRRETLGRMGAILDYAGLREVADVAAKHLSDGMRLRLALSVALHLPHRVLVSDEGLATADAEFLRQVEETMAARRRAGVAVLVASHDPETVRRVADRAVLLDEGAVADDGPAGPVLDRYLARASGADHRGAGDRPTDDAARSGRAGSARPR
jgi:ABC-2 type transport system ATP-binding protein